MHCEYPVQETDVLPFLKKQVGVVLLDGTHHYGLATGCAKGKLLLGPLHQSGEAIDMRTKSMRRRTLKKRTNVTPIDLASIALLFAII
jgi:hypothetical protein